MRKKEVFHKTVLNGKKTELNGKKKSFDQPKYFLILNNLCLTSSSGSNQHKPNCLIVISEYHRSVQNSQKF